MKRTFLVTVLAGALCAAGCFTNPVTGRKSLVLLSPEQEVQLGAQSFADVEKSERVSTDRAANERVQRVGQRIAQAVGSDMPSASWQFTVFDSPSVNAFALPGGKVGVYTGLLNLAATDDELATVIGHEIGHVIARHGAERVSQASIISGVGQFSSAALQSYTNNPQMLQLFQIAYGGGTALGVTLPHSRKQESEADRMGVVYAAKAGYDPRASLEFWQKMMAQSAGKPAGLAAWFSSHPSDQTRIADLQAMMPEMVAIYEANRRR